VHLLVYELYRYQNARYNDKNYTNKCLFININYTVSGIIRPIGVMITKTV